MSTRCSSGRSRPVRKSQRPVMNQFYGDRSGTLEDPFGHLWTVSNARRGRRRRRRCAAVLRPPCKPGRNAAGRRLERLRRLLPSRAYCIHYASHKRRQGARGEAASAAITRGGAGSSWSSTRSPSSCSLRACSALHSLPLPWTTKKINLLIASYLFYAAWNPPFVILLWVSTVVDWYAAQGLVKARRAERRGTPGCCCR